MNYKSIAVVILALLGAYLLADLLILLFIAFLITTAFLPIVQKLQEKNIPRALTASVVVFALFIAPLALIASLGPLIIEQGEDLVSSLPGYVERIENRFDINVGEELDNRLSTASDTIISNIFALTSTALRTITSLVIVLVISVYWLIYYQQAKKSVISFLTTNKKQQRHVTKTLSAVEKRLGSWVKGQLLISVAVGLLTWIVLTILGVPYAGVLALIAALLEIIPTLGPILAAAPALLVALTVSPGLVIAVLITYIVIQQIESYVIAPRLMGTTVRVNPFAVLLAIIVGANLLGIIGALIAVPFMITAQEIIKGYRSYAN